jgi:hypothetical protein
VEPPSKNAVLVAINGVLQNPDAYSVSGTNVVLNTAPANGDDVNLRNLGYASRVDGVFGDIDVNGNADFAGSTLLFDDGQISGDAIDGGTITNFASTGIDDNASSTTITINNSDDVGIGEASPRAKLHVAESNVTTNTYGFQDTLIVEGSSAGINFVHPDDKNAGLVWSSPSDPLGAIVTWNYDDRDLTIGTKATNGKIKFEAENGSYIGQFSDLGFFVGTTNAAPAFNNVLGCFISEDGKLDINNSSNPARIGTRNTGTVVQFYYQGSATGNISTNGSTVSYNTGSDRRLKENDRPISDAVERILSTKWVAFDFIGTGVYCEGVIAQDEAERWPTAISYDSDAGQWNADYSKMIPGLGAALSEALGRIETLEDRIAKLEAKLRACSAETGKELD